MGKTPVRLLILLGFTYALSACGAKDRPTPGLTDQADIGQPASETSVSPAPTESVPPPINQPPQTSAPQVPVTASTPDASAPVAASPAQEPIEPPVQAPAQPAQPPQRTAALPPPTTQQPKSAGGCGPMTDVTCDIFNRINAQRSAHGLKALVPLSNCIAAAQAESQDMADNHFFSHDSPTHGGFSQRAQAYNLVSGAGSSGENIAYQSGTSDSVIVTMWMNSSGHRANILNSSYNSTGVGFARDKNGRNYYTQCFSSDNGD